MRIGRVVLWVALAVGIVQAQGQQPKITNMKVQGFKASPEFFEPPYERQMKWLLEGAEAEPLPAGTYLVRQAKLQKFQQDGQQELLVETPQCVYDPSNYNVSGSSPLRAQTGDGKFRIEGEGFLWQTNATLTISNRVHTVVQGRPQTGTNRSEPVPGREAPPHPPLPLGAGEGGPIEVFSDRLDYSRVTGMGAYQGHVRVTGTNLALRAGTMTVELPMDKSGKLSDLKSITALEDVVVEYEAVQATGQKAVYTASSGLLEMTGHPSWRSGSREGGAEQLTVDPTNQVLLATGMAWLKMVETNSGAAGFLPETSATTNASATNQTVEIRCGSYQIQTNQAMFRDAVRVAQTRDAKPAGEMVCTNLQVTFSGSNQVSQLLAVGDVILSRPDQELRAGNALYSGTDRILQLIEQPRWRTGPRQGGGDIIFVKLANEEMSVQGNAWLRLPAEQIGLVTPSLGAPPSSPASPARQGAPAGPDPVGSAPRAAEIRCWQYDISRKSASFKGQTRLTHPQLNLGCDHIDAQFSPQADSVESMLAEQAVTLDLIGQEGQKVHGTGDRVAYSFNKSGATTNELVRLIGQPAVLEGSNATVRNSLIIFDRANNRVFAPGSYSVVSTASANTASGTNAVVWSKKKPKK